MNFSYLYRNPVGHGRHAGWVAALVAAVLVLVPFVGAVPVARAAAGSVDTAFSANLGDGFDNTVRSVVEQSDGKILVSGEFTSVNGAASNRVTIQGVVVQAANGIT